MRSLLLIIALALSGCFGAGDGPGQLSQEQADLVAQQAVERFAADFSSVDGGDLRLVRGEFGAMDMGLGYGQAVFEAEWGRDGTARVEMTVGSGAESMTVGMHCGTDRNVITFGDERLEARPSLERSCLDALQEDDGVAVGGFDSGDVREVTAHEDGSVTATFSSEDGNMTARIDPKGRLVRIDIDSPQDGGFMVAEYGPRRSIPVPEATTRMPALVFGFGMFDGAQYSWTASSAQESVPWTDIEVRVQDPDQATVASFVPGPAQQSEAGFTFAFADDGDGAFGLNDSFTLRSDAWTQSGQYDVIVWDVWADRAVGDMPVPAPAVAVLLLALAAVALARR